MEGDLVRQGGVAVALVVGCAPGLPHWDAPGLHVTGAPPLDPAIAAALDPYELVVGSRLVEVTPGGVLVLRDGDAAMVRAPGAEPIALTHDVDVAWAALRGGAVVYTADRGGDEDTRLSIAPAHGRVADPIAAGDRIAWAESDNTATSLWIFDGAPRRVATLAGAWAPLDVSRDGTELLARRTRSFADQTLVRIDVATGAATALGPGTAGKLGARGELIADPAWDEVCVSPDGRTAAFTTTDDDGASRLQLYDVASGATRAAPGAPTGGVITDLRWGAALGFSFTDARHPRDAYTLDAGALVAWTHAEVPADPVEPERAHVAGFDGTPIAMLVYRPRRVRAVVVELHGGPEDRWRPRWAPLEQFLASRGFAIVQPDVRGSAGHGAAFAALDDGRRRTDAVRDVGAVLDWVAREFAGRPVAVMGQSYGGYLALASLIAYPDRLRAGIDIVGIADLAAFLAGTSAYRRDLRRAEYGDERDPATRAFLDEISPLRRAAQIRAPLLVAQGRRDPRVPPADADRLVAAVRGAGGTVWYVVADDEGHGFVRTEHRLALDVLVTELLGELR